MRALTLGVCMLLLAVPAFANAPAHAPVRAPIPECTFVHTAGDVPGYNEDRDWDGDTGGLVRANASSFREHVKAASMASAEAAAYRALPRGLSPPGGKYACAHLCTDAVNCTRFVYRPHGQVCFLGGVSVPHSKCRGVRGLESWSYTACRAPPGVCDGGL